jgi:Fic family protein
MVAMGRWDLRAVGRYREQLNERQEEMLLRVFREGVEGFKGGLSANNQVRITGCSPATAMRDLAKLVELGAMVRTGKLKNTRYFVKFG